MEQARRSSASTSASRGLPTSVRSPQRTSTCALAEISANRSRNNEVRSSLTCRSPMAAKVNASELAGMSSLTRLAYVAKTPFSNRRLVIDRREHSTAAYLHARGRQVELPIETAEQFVHEPARHVVAFARVSPTEIEKVDQQHFPVQVHVIEETPPIDPLVLLEYQMHDVRAVVAMPQLNECFGPDELGRRDHAHWHAEYFDAGRVIEPSIAHRHGAMPGGEDQIEEVLAAENLGDPTLVLDLDRIAEALEVLEDGRAVARLANDVEILGRARDAGIDAERIGAAQQERQPEFRQFAQGVGIERLGQRRRRSRFGCRVDGANMADCLCLAWHEIVGQNSRALAMSSAPAGQLNKQHKVPFAAAFVSHDAALPQALASRTSGGTM